MKISYKKKKFSQAPTFAVYRGFDFVLYQCLKIVPILKRTYVECLWACLLDDKIMTRALSRVEENNGTGTIIIVP